MKLALVHDYLLQIGGAERVLLSMHKLWPEAPIFTSIHNPNCFAPVKTKLSEIYWSRLQQIPFVGKFYKYFTFFYPLVFESFDFSGFDVVISSSSNFAKGIIVGPDTLHISFCHTPPRFLYHYPTETNRREHWFWGKPLTLLDHWLRTWDFCAAQRVDYFVASSQTVADRIMKFYRREAEVIYPPVEINSKPCLAGPLRLSEASRRVKTQNSKLQKKSYFLVVSRFAAYKNVHLAIQACNSLNLPLKIVGVGREEKKLRRMAGQTIEFLGQVEDKELADLYTNCQAVIFPSSEEDFGMVPVEAMSFSKPVICLRSGGVTETVIDGVTGVFFEEADVDSLIEVLRHFDAKKFHPENCLKQARKFSKVKFEERFKNFVEEKWKEYSKLKT